MADFSVILQNPQVRSLVQENILERAFHDALFPRLLFRAEATPIEWPAGVGDTMVFSAPGLMPVDAQPLRPGQDPVPDTYPVEQWTAQLQQYAKSIDTHMPTSMVAIVSLFLRNASQLGLQAAQTINRIVRNRMYAAALSGMTVVDVAAVSTTSIHVKRMNGFTRARNPALSGSQQVRFELVSAGNPLAVTVFDNGAAASRNVVGFNPDTPGDEQGPGTLILDVAVVNTLARAYLYSFDSTAIDRVGGGLSTDALTSSNLPTLADIRTTVARFWQNGVPEHPDGRFHAHFDPVSQAKIFDDAEFQRLLTALPDYYMYRQFALGEILNTVFLRNNECPVPETVVGGKTGTYSLADPFPGELWSKGAPGISGSIKVHRILFTSQGGIMEYYSNLDALITEAGITGTVGDPRIENNGININSDRIQLIIRGPLNRLQDTVATSWKIMADWPTRTDAAVGTDARYKRFAVIEHGE